MFELFIINLPAAFVMFLFRRVLSRSLVMRRERKPAVLRLYCSPGLSVKIKCISRFGQVSVDIQIDYTQFRLFILPSYKPRLFSFLNI